MCVGQVVSDNTNDIDQSLTCNAFQNNLALVKVNFPPPMLKLDYRPFIVPYLRFFNDNFSHWETFLFFLIFIKTKKEDKVYSYYLSRNKNSDH